LPKVLDYIGVNGSLAALGALFLVPLGYRVGQSITAFSNTRPRPALIGALLLTVLFWIAGVMIQI
jgi:hypothetical protein